MVYETIQTFPFSPGPNSGKVVLFGHQKHSTELSTNNDDGGNDKYDNIGNFDYDDNENDQQT